jgi:uncharacterized protein (TIGR00369 family)
MVPTRAALHPPAPDHVTERWSGFGQWDRIYFPAYLGLQLEEVRTDYARMRLPFKPELEQPAGVVHGGAIAAVLDSVVVPAIGQAYAADSARFVTVDMHIQYVGAAVGEDLVAEGWIVRRGKRVVFCEAEVHGGTTGRMIAKSMLTYNVQLVGQ